MARLKAFWSDEELTRGGRIGVAAVAIAAAILLTW